MAASNAIIGKGVTFGYKDTGTTTTYTTLAELTGVQGPQEQVDEVDVTHSTSPDGFREFKPGWINGGEVTVDLNYLGSEAATIMGLLGVEKAFKITMTGGANVVFNGFIKQRGIATPIDGKVTQQITVKVNGKPTHATS